MQGILFSVDLTGGIFGESGILINISGASKLISVSPKNIRILMDDGSEKEGVIRNIVLQRGMDNPSAEFTIRIDFEEKNQKLLTGINFSEIKDII